MAKKNVNVSSLAQLLRVLGDETRLRVLMELQEAGEMNVTQLHKKLRSPQPTVSHHLGILRMSGLVNNRRDGKEIYYSINSLHRGKGPRALKAMLDGSSALRLGDVVIGLAAK